MLTSLFVPWVLLEYRRPHIHSVDIAEGVPVVASLVAICPMSDGSVTREERFGDIDETSVATDLTPKFRVAATLCVD